MEEKIYQFVTELLNFKPRVWRRIQISSKLNIEDLMDVMMVIYECQFNHLYELTLPKGENDYNKKKRENPDADIDLVRNDFVYPIKTSISKFDISEEDRAFMREMEEELIRERLHAQEYFREKDKEIIKQAMKGMTDKKIVDFNEARALIDSKKSDKLSDIEKIVKKNIGGYSYKDAAGLIESLNLDLDDKLYFTYDFGDNWEFQLKLEKILDPKEINNPHIPRVVNGKCFGILEDIGGVYAMKEFIETDNILEEFKYYYKSDHNPVLREMFDK
ncbi:IS1096 element passenger TnpR family protein [uncultured Anaerococcus sp.]|uniref:IS1096 element passenger TnpR family protein n=1 Tax=uncultured Anaerococcus sp. TaxID=293428 RepID=UPI0025E29B9E|nr:hypothetical protein [uncultured Anaerococcus sp.]